MKTILKIVAGIIIAFILLVGGCVALISGAAEEVEKESQEHSITEEQYKSVKKGDTLREIKKQFGEPEDEQTSEVEGMKMDCIYYPVKDGEFMDSYQFCFDNGKLSSKSRY